MAWFGESITSLTGQISNFTKEILTESTEEIRDHETELKLAKTKIKDLEASVSILKSENERFKRVNQDLSEKMESSELQIFRVSNEYRTILTQKERECAELKEKYNQLLEHQTKSDQLLTAGSQSSLSYGNVQGHAEDEFSDNISMQKEINGLRHKVQQLQLQCDHWQNKVQHNQSSEINSLSRPNGNDFSEITLLKSELKEVRRQVAEDREKHQQETCALQDLHSHQISTVKNQNKVHVDELNLTIAQLQSELNDALNRNEDMVSEAEKSETISLLTDIKNVKNSVSNVLHKGEIIPKNLNPVDIEGAMAGTDNINQDESVVDELQTKLLETENELRKATLHNSDLEQSLDELDEQHNTVVNELLQIKEGLLVKISELEKSVHSRDDVINDLNYRLQSKVDEYTSTKLDVMTHLEAEILELKARLVEQNEDKTQIEELNQKLLENDTDLHKLQVEKSDLQSKLDGKNSEIYRLLDELKSLKVENDELNPIRDEYLNYNEGGYLNKLSSEVASFSDNLLGVESENSQLKFDEHTMKTSSVDVEESDKNQENKLVELQEELLILRGQYSRSTEENKKYDANVLELSEKVSYLEKQLLESERILNIEQLQLSEYKDTNNDLRENISLLEAELREVSTGELASQIDEYELKIKNLERDLYVRENSLASQVEHYEKCIHDLKTSNDDSQEKLKQQLKSFSEEKLANETKVNDLNSVICNMQEEINKYRESLVDYNKSNEILQSASDENNKVLEDKLQIIADLEKRLKDEYENHSKTHDLYTSLLNEYNDIQNDLDASSKIAINNPRSDIITESAPSDIDSDVIGAEYEQAPIPDTSQSADASYLKSDVFEDQLQLKHNLESLKEECQKKDEEISILSKELSNLKQMSINNNDKNNKQFEDLQSIIKNKEKLISDLQKVNSSYLKMAESKSLPANSDKFTVEYGKLHNEVQHLRSEKEHMMAVLNEKTRECSSLKSEVHRLMSTVMAEKNALNKLQQDNALLNSSPMENKETEMQKDAIQKLSNLIRSKDLEIESLSMKNQSLVEVLQTSSQNSEHVNSLITEKDVLSQKCSELTMERDRLTLQLNQKQQENQTDLQKMETLSSQLLSESESSQHWEHKFMSLKSQYEDCKQALVTCRDELVIGRQKYVELEIRFGEMAQRDDIKNTVDLASYNERVGEVNQLKSGLMNVEKSLHEKIHELSNLHHSLSEHESKLKTSELERNNYKKQLENSAIQIHILQSEINDLHDSLSLKEEQFKKQLSEVHLLKEMNDSLTLAIKDKDLEVSSMKDKLFMLKSVMNESENEVEQLKIILNENETLQKQTQANAHERDQLLLALKQRHQENMEQEEEVQQYKIKEQKQSVELNRLRDHLLKIEESYTCEALEAESREKELRNKLAELEEQLINSSEVIVSSRHQASNQMENFTLQLSTLTNQRDNAYLQVASLQEQNQDFQLQLSNLQMVLDEFQTEREINLATETERLEVEISKQKEEISGLTSQLHYTQEQLSETVKGLDAAARLSEQLDRKNEMIAALREEVQTREQLLNRAQNTIENQALNSESRVDKEIMKNLVLGYFSAPASNKSDVVHTIGGILGFNADDFRKALGEDKSWVPGFLRFRQPSGSRVRSRQSSQSSDASTDQNKSFSELFVQFLEKESTPKPIVRLPAQQMANEAQRQREKRAAFNPFTAPRHATLPITDIRGSATNPHPLMPSDHMGNSDLPLFLDVSARSLSKSPAASHNPLLDQSRYTNSPSALTFNPAGSAILQNALQPR